MPQAAVACRTLSHLEVRLNTWSRPIDNDQESGLILQAVALAV